MSATFAVENEVLVEELDVCIYLIVEVGVCLSIFNDEVICVNVGDSRCISGYCTTDNRIFSIPLSFDHTPMRMVFFILFYNCRMSGLVWNLAELK